MACQVQICLMRDILNLTLDESTLKKTAEDFFPNRWMDGQRDERVLGDFQQQQQPQQINE